jgi:hypothetical protein
MPSLICCTAGRLAVHETKLNTNGEAQYDSTRSQNAAPSRLKLPAFVLPSGLRSNVSLHVLPVHLSLSSNGVLDLLSQLDVCLTALSNDLDAAAVVASTPVTPPTDVVPPFNNSELGGSRKGLNGSGDGAVAGDNCAIVSHTRRQQITPQPSMTVWTSLAAAGIVVADSRGLARTLAAVQYLVDGHCAGVLLESVSITTAATRAQQQQATALNEMNIDAGDDDTPVVPSQDEDEPADSTNERIVSFGLFKRSLSGPSKMNSASQAPILDPEVASRMQRTRTTIADNGEIEMLSRAPPWRPDQQRRVEPLGSKAVTWYRFIRAMEYARPLIVLPLTSTINQDEEEDQWANGGQVPNRLVADCCIGYIIDCHIVSLLYCSYSSFICHTWME